MALKLYLLGRSAFSAVIVRQTITQADHSATVWRETSDFVGESGHSFRSDSIAGASSGKIMPPTLRQPQRATIWSTDWITMEQILPGSGGGHDRDAAEPGDLFGELLSEFVIGLRIAFQNVRDLRVGGVLQQIAIDEANDDASELGGQALIELADQSVA